MAASTAFSERIGDLRRKVGSEKITATVTVDQIYAHYIHEHLEFRHPRGGEAKFLERPLFDRHRDYLHDYARTVLHDGGQTAMERAARDLSDQVELNAPREWGDLMLSGHASVEQGGRIIYDRPPKVARLTAAELRVKSRAIMRMRLAEGLTVYFMRRGKVMVIPGKNEPHERRGRL